MARVQSIKSRINGKTGAYLGNKNRHSLTPGNKLASRKTVYRQLRRSFGLSSG